MNRRSLTPAAGLPIEGILAQRRAQGGARREISARILFKGEDGRELEGWALNISRGGIRVLIEELVELGDVFVLDEQESPALHAHKARVVWVQNEPDGAIAGLEFLDVEPGHRVPGPSGSVSPPSAPPGKPLSNPPPRPISGAPIKPMSSPPPSPPDSEPPPPPDAEPLPPPDSEPPPADAASAPPPDAELPEKS